MTRYAHVTGWGSALPEHVMTNKDLEQMVDTSDEWIVSRTGIRERRIASPDQTTASLAADAASRALKTAGVHPTEVDLIIVATSSPEHIFPATACIVQDMLGATKAGAFDLSAACTGFIFALNMAAQAIRTGSIDTALVIGAETLSRIVNWQDRNTCILFGDGAGAFVLQGSNEPGGVLEAVMHADGSGADVLMLPAGGSKIPTSPDTVAHGLHYLYMEGRPVFRFATRVMAEAAREVVEKAGLSLEDIQWIIPHQANIRILEVAARHLKLPMERFVVNLDRYGNTSTASIPIATTEAAAQGKLHPGDKVVLVGFGGGLTYGAALLEWTGPFPGHPEVNPERYRLWARVRSAGLRLKRKVLAAAGREQRLGG